MTVSLTSETAAAIEALVERLRREACEIAQKFDLERARTRRLYAENVELAAKVRRLEAEKRRLVEQLGEAMLPRSM